MQAMTPISPDNRDAHVSHARLQARRASAHLRYRLRYRRACQLIVALGHQPPG